MHLCHHSHGRAWRNLARPTHRPASRAHASSSCSPVRLRMHARSPRRPLPSHPRGTTGARGAAHGPSTRWRARSCDAVAPMGLAKHLRACVTVARVGFVPYQRTTAEHALLSNAAANFGNICIGAQGCRHAHAPAGAITAIRRLLRAPPAPPASNSVTCRKICN
ncbi:hypothetical protein T492DRAFT_960889 [Pavlovales sp. CCMP2436]|nr:hypothetical protein T492DRAFT_960889 [Pavlovales sp. CCMP2436]